MARVALLILKTWDELQNVALATHATDERAAYLQIQQSHLWPHGLGRDGQSCTSVTLDLG